jgi:hypothetical protein
VAGSPQYATLVANQVSTLLFEQGYRRIEVLNVDGTDAVYFRVGQTDPEIGSTGSQVLPAAICALELDVTTAGPTEVRLISAGTPLVSVRGIVDVVGRS